MKASAQSLLKKGYFVCVLEAAVLLCSTSHAIAESKPSESQLAAITARGRMLAAYDTAAWQATDAVMAAHPKADPSGRYIGHLTETGWVVDFGNLSAAGDKFLVSYEATQVGGPAHFDVKTFDPARQDEGWNLSAAKGIGTAMKDFGRADRPYNIAALPKQGGGLYVYLYPAQVKAGVYPMGADVRYLLSPDGTKVIEKRQMHKTILEYAPPTDPHAHDWDWGKKPPRQPGRALTPEEQKNVKRAAGGVTAGVIIYWIISEGSRLFPPRNLIPIP